MARKSNKTAHVLNLLAGNDAKKDQTPEEPIEEKVEKAEEAKVAETPAVSVETPAAPAAPSAEPAAPAPAPAQSVSVINPTGPDPVAELIHEQLLSELNDELNKDIKDINTPSGSFSTDFIETPEPASEPVIELQPEPVSEPVVVTESEPITESVVLPEPEPTPEPVVIPEPEPEPDFVRVNIMERIVEDKIIYFMREFDVCTCDRCKADVIALTLNGLPARYIVTSPFAVEPLMSFYTNKYISEVTVEATKACVVIRDNPRH